MKTNSVKALLVGLVLMATSDLWREQAMGQIVITNVAVRTNAGRYFTFSHLNSRSDSYYVVRSGDTTTNISNPRNAALGEDLVRYGNWYFRFPMQSPQEFFRVAEYPNASPLDLDGDGIDDVYELRHGRSLNPLSADDARSDFDHDGDSNLLEYHNRTNPEDYFNDPSPVVWQPANARGIELGGNPSQWLAGGISDVLPNGPTAILVSCPKGGVWSVTSGGFAQRLSDDWKSPDVNCLVQGPDGSGHFFAAGAALYETDVTDPTPVLRWRQVPGGDLPRSQLYGRTIFRAVVIPSLRRIVVATDWGVYWSPIPAAGAGVAGYEWKKAFELPAVTFSGGDYRGMALGPGNRVIVAADGSGGGEHYGLFFGEWSGEDLVFQRSTIQDVDPTQMRHTLVASCASQPSRLYALSKGSDSRLLAILRSDDGGTTWSPCSLAYEGAPAGKTVADYTANWPEAGALDVSPYDPNVVAFGMATAPFVSVNGGVSWFTKHQTFNNVGTLVTYWHMSRATALRFDPADPTSQRIFIGYRNGVILTPDRGGNFQSDYNRNLANLEFLGPAGTILSGGDPNVVYGIMGVFDFPGATAFTGGTSSGNLQSANGGSWTRTPGAASPGWPGGPATILPTGTLLETDYNRRWTKTSAWDAGKTSFVKTAQVWEQPAWPSTVPSTGVTNPIVELIDWPVFANPQGQLLYAVGGVQNRVLGLFSDNNGGEMHWSPMATLPFDQTISAVGSFDGTRIYAAAVGGRLFSIEAGSGVVTENPSQRTNGFSVSKFALLSRDAVFGLAQRLSVTPRDENESELWRSLYGSNWQVVTNLYRNEAVPSRLMLSLATDATTQPGQLFVVGDGKLFVSFDAGDTWRRATNGLPNGIHGSDLRVANSPDGLRQLYLSTYGHSMWRAQLADYNKYPLAAAGTQFSGNFVQGTWGEQGNFELLVPRGDFVFHYSRDNGAGGYPWKFNSCLREAAAGGSGGTLIAGGVPKGVALIQSRLGNPGYPGTLEAVVRMEPTSPLFTEHWLAHYYFDSVARQWRGPFPIRVNGQLISGVTGDPALIQSTFGNGGNYELLVPMGNVIAHFWRDNDAPGFPWHRAANLPCQCGSGPVSNADPLGVAILESNFRPAPNQPGTFEAVVRFRPVTGVNGDQDYLGYYYFDTIGRQWYGPTSLSVGGQPVTGVTGTPALIQSTYGISGNYEMLVPLGDRVAHFWRNNDAPGYPWQRAPDFPRVGGGPNVAVADPIDVALLQSRFTSVQGTLEAVVRLRPRLSLFGESDYLAYYYRNNVTGQWVGPASVIENGQPVDGLSGF